MLGITGGDPAFRDDDGSAAPNVVSALAAFADGRESEHAAIAALAGSRLLVPVVATSANGNAARAEGERGEGAAEMALPTLVGLDGRRAVPAFTSLDSMQRWQPAARPVPVAAQHVWQAAIEDDCAVVVDVGGPVPLAVEGARLMALARGEPAPLLHQDPDVREIVTDVLSSRLEVASYELRSADAGEDLGIGLTLAGGTSDGDIAGLAADIGNAIMARLGGRLRRGVVIWFA